MKTPVPKLRQAANDNEKEHETANCITYSYAAPPPPRNTPTCSLLAPLWERVSSVVVVVVGGGGGNTLFGSEDDRSLLDSSLDSIGSPNWECLQTNSTMLMFTFDSYTLFLKFTDTLTNR